MNAIQKIIGFVAAGIVLVSCSSNGDRHRDGSVACRWDFNDAEGWFYTHQDTASHPQWYLEKDSLVIFTRANTRDRQKMRTLQENFTSGTYEWRIKVPDVAPGEQASTAGFIYNDDMHEIDFEIGYGTAAARTSCGAKAGEMVACMTNQGGPYFSGYAPVTPGWHTFAIRLDVVEGKYSVAWVIDGNVKQTRNVEFGPEYGFSIYCSVENLLFIGDSIPLHDTYAKFDYVSFDGRLSD